MLTSGLDTHILCIYMYKCLLYTHAYLFKKKKPVTVTHLIPAGRFLSSRLAWSIDQVPGQPGVGGRRGMGRGRGGHERPSSEETRVFDIDINLLVETA